MTYQAQIFPALAEAVLYVKTSLDVPLALYLPHTEVPSLLRPDPVEPGPARPLTDWTGRTDWTCGGAGAPPPPPAAGRRRDVVHGSATGGVGLEEGPAGLYVHQLVDQGSGGGPLQTVLHRVLHLNIIVRVLAVK